MNAPITNKDGEKKMPEETFHGVPRSKIPWYPTIDYEKCISCGKCVDYCKLGVYEFEEKQGKKRPAVKNPNSCVMLCTGCQEICPAGAIKHPSKTETREIIRKLRKAKT
jgi:NAD-dependent dihydropyrimidine dehydrogenase PreA subunit